VSVTGDSEPAPDDGDAGPARQAQRASGGRDAFVVGRDFVVNVNIPPARPDQGRPATGDQGADPGRTGRAGSRGRGAPGLGDRLFRASVGAHAGRLAVAFGAHDTLVVTDQEGAIHRWSLSDQAALPGAPGRGSAPLRADLLYGTGTQVAVSTTIPAVAIARGARLTLVHFTGGGHVTSSFPLGWSEFLVAGSGERFAIHDDRRMAVRDFTDGTTAWELPCPRSIVTAAIDQRGTTVAMAGAANWLAPSRRFIVASQDDPRPREFTFENLWAPGAACRLGLSPDGELVVCASFREILLARPGTGETMQRRPISSVREEIIPALGLRPHRLICLAGGQVLWLRGRRVVDVNWSAEKFRYLPQDGLCDDIAFDHAGSRLAMAGESGQVDVFEWRGL
jgi:hypothetical protein